MFASAAPAASPRAVMLGHFVAASTASIVLNFFPTDLISFIDPATLAGVLSMIGMVLTKSTHPPACAYAFLCTKNAWHGLKPFVFPGPLGCLVLLGAQKGYNFVVNSL